MLPSVTVCQGPGASHPVPCLNHTGEIHGSSLSQGRNGPAEAHQKTTAKFNHSLPASLDFFKLGPLFWGREDVKVTFSSWKRGSTQGFLFFVVGRKRIPQNPPPDS